MVIIDGSAAFHSGSLIVRSRERAQVIEPGAPTLTFSEGASDGVARIDAIGDNQGFSFSFVNLNPGDRMAYQFQGVLSTGVKVRGTLIVDRVAEMSGIAVYQVNYTVIQGQ